MEERFLDGGREPWPISTSAQTRSGSSGTRCRDGSPRFARATGRLCDRSRPARPGVRHEKRSR